MKQFILAFLAILSFQLAFAQKGQKMTPEQRASRTSTALQRKLYLNDDQKAKIYQAVLTKITKMQALKEQNLEKTALLQQSKPIRDEFQASMQQILTPEQYQGWQNLRSKALEKGRKGNGKGKGRDKGDEKGKRDKKGEPENEAEEKSDSLSDAQ